MYIVLMKNINRKDIWKAIIHAKSKEEMDGIIDGLNSCDALWLMDEINNLPTKSKKYLTEERYCSKV